MKRRLTGWLPHVRIERRLNRLQDMVQRVDGQVQRVAHFGLGSSATYLGNNLVLVRLIVGRHLMILYVHADDKLISPGLIVNGGYEPDLTDYFVKELRPDSHCIDVGANIGYFTCLLSRYCPNGRVIGIEPNPVVRALAVDNLLINALHEQGSVLAAAASDQAGETILFHRIGRAGNTSIAQCGEDFTSQLQEPPEEPFRVPTLRIDDLRDRMSGRVDFMKIDVEGAEPLALAGARETIASNPQLRIVMEWAPAQIHHAGFDIAAFAGEIAAAGLDAFMLAESPPRAISHTELAGLAYQSGVLLQRRAA